MLRLRRCLALLSMGTVLLVPAQHVTAEILPADSPPQSGNRCSNVQLMIQPYRGANLEADGALHRVVVYRMHETWGAPCTLDGYPRVQFLDGHFMTSYPTHARQGGSANMGYWKPQHVVLNSHTDAYFALESSIAPQGGATCPAVPYLMIIPPNDRLPVITYADIMGKTGPIFRPCNLTAIVSPVVHEASQLMP